MPTDATFLLAALFILFGAMGFIYKFYCDRDRDLPPRISADYIRGLNLVLSRRTDEALELFVQMAKVDDDTLETHFALGHLFRRRGEIERAIRVHENLLPARTSTKPSGTKPCSRWPRTTSARGCSTVPSSCSTSCATARRLPMRHSRSSSASTSASRSGRRHRRVPQARNAARHEVEPIAHYYCELAELARAAGDRALAREHLRDTVRSESGALRGTLIRATLAREEQDYAQAIPLYEQVIAADRHFITEVLPPLLECYRAADRLPEFDAYLERLMAKDATLHRDLAYAAIIGVCAARRARARRRALRARAYRAGKPRECGRAAQLPDTQRAPRSSASGKVCALSRWPTPAIAARTAATARSDANGAKVVGIDRFSPPHDQGSSHGLTRITRLAVGEGAAFVPLAMRSHALWPELEAASGETLYRRTGGLVIGSAASDIARVSRPTRLPRPDDRPGAALRHRPRAARRGGDPRALPRLSRRRRRAAATSSTMPACSFPSASSPRSSRRPGAMAPPSGSTSAFSRSRPGPAASRSSPTAAGCRRRASSSPPAPGPPGLAGNAFGTRLRVLRQVLYWFGVDEPALYAPERCPVFIWLHGSDGQRASMYGFPMVDGVAGPKVASEQDTVESDPDAVDRQVGRRRCARRPRRPCARPIARHHRRGCCAPPPAFTPARPTPRSCVRPHPESEAITFVSACSGHGFKHSAALGEALAERLAGRTPPVSLAPFLAPP